MHWLSDSKRNLDDAFNHFARTPACPELTDKQTDGRIDISRIVFMTNAGVRQKPDSLCKYQ